MKASLPATQNHVDRRRSWHLNDLPRLASECVCGIMIQRLRRSVPSSLSRCRSACGTWTTTTSATGMPSLDTEPPASSRRPHLAMGPDGQRGAAASSERVSRQRLLTSDYESSDSPSSSEHGEHVVQRLSTSSSLSADRRRDAVPDTTDNADGDASPSPTSPFSFHVEQARDQVLQYWRGETILLQCVPKNVALCIFWITQSKISRFQQFLVYTILRILATSPL